MVVPKIQWRAQRSEDSPSGFSESTDIGFPADGDITLTASCSFTTPGGLSRFWHDSTPPLCDATNTGLDTKADMDGSSEAEQSTTTETGPSTEASWGEGDDFEPYVESRQWESTQSQSISSSL